MTARLWCLMKLGHFLCIETAKLGLPTSVRQNCATDTSAIKKYFSNGHVFYKDFFFFFFKVSFHPHLLNMTYSLYQPVKPTSKSISVVSCKIHSGSLGS